MNHENGTQAVRRIDRRYSGPHFPLPQAVCAGQIKQAAAIAATIAISAMVSVAFLAAGHHRQQHRPVPGQQKIDALREQYRTNAEPQGT
ncbi:hypothetical protein LPY96_19350 [Xanthomonas citri pv. malvacearum]|uniref:hypothetical protein n=1 Tax=Xanthomonas citri TaxID=346 RepID=UPI0022B04B81|nr:hypothetical protein [Xanthomonas citri]WAW86377.1 hypothetical protein LPY96_19350 [Xanthomonas citri pv. malvacearum]